MRLRFFNPDALYVTPPFEGEVRGTTTYKLSEVIRDTTSITQDDPEEQTIENEFGSAPILKNTHPWFISVLSRGSRYAASSS